MPVFQQYVYILTAFFEGAAHSKHSIEISSNKLLAHNNIAEFLEKAAWDTYRVVAAQNLFDHPPTDRRRALKAFRRLLEKISSLLLSVTQSNSERVPANPVHLLYFCAIYIRRLNSLRFHSDLAMDQQATGILEESIINMRTCKPAILDRGGGMNNIPRYWVSEADRYGSVIRFSEEWWWFLYGKHDEHCKDSESAGSHRKRHPAPPTAMVSLGSAPTYPKPMIPMSGFRTPSSSTMLAPPERVAAFDSMNSVYTDESYASTCAETPITSGYNSFVSSPIMDEKGRFFDTSPVIPHSASSLKKDNRNTAPPRETASRLPTASSAQQILQQRSEAPLATTAMNDIELETIDHASSTTVAGRLPVQQSIQFPSPVHTPSDSPYNGVIQR